MPVTPTLLTVEEAAEALGITPEALLSLRRVGAGPQSLVTAGGAVHYDQRAITAWRTRVSKRLGHQP